MRKERLIKIESYINRNGIVTMEKISEEFGIAMPTVRKDITELVKAGRVEKVYGGAKSIKMQDVNLHTFKNRRVMNSYEKDLVAAKAAEFIAENDIIYLDSGTTIAGILRYIGNKNVTVITSNIEVVIECIRYEKINVIIIGGKLNRETMTIDHVFPLEGLADFNIDKAFMASTGYSLEGGIAQDSTLEADIKKHIIKIATESFLIIDSSKVGRKALVKYADIEEIPNVIVDSKISEEHRRRLAEKKVKLIIAE